MTSTDLRTWPVTGPGRDMPCDIGTVIVEPELVRTEQPGVVA
jgi:hypothetical protein